MKRFLAAIAAIFFVGSGVPVLALENSAPEFSIDLYMSATGPQLSGYFPSVSTDMLRVRPYYSFDGANYYPIDGEGLYDWNLDEEYIQDNPYTAQNQLCANSCDEPLTSYAAGLVDSFYIKLRVTTAKGEYDSQACQVSRPSQAQPLPDDIQAYTLYPASMREGFGMNVRAKYQITAKAGATREELRSLLPKTLPVEIQLYDQMGDCIFNDTVGYRVDWNLPDVVPEDGITIENAAAALYPPNDFKVKTLHNYYKLDSPPQVQMPLTLTVNTVPEDTKAAPNLHASVSSDLLYATFPLKPSGATSIHLSYSLDGGDTWVQGNDLLHTNKAVDTVPKNIDYRYVELFDADQSPYREYLTGESEGFLVRFDITGGTFEGLSETLEWPRDYEYVPPKKDLDVDGSGGNRGDIGAGGSMDENGGQRPGLSDEDDGSASGESTSPTHPKLPALAQEQPGTEEQVTSKSQSNSSAAGEIAQQTGLDSTGIRDNSSGLISAIAVTALLLTGSGTAVFLGVKHNRKIKRQKK